MKIQLDKIRAEATYGGKEPINHSPSFDFCRKLISKGYDPEEALEVYRGEELAYTVKSIGLGAKLKIREDNFHSPHEVPYVPMTEKDKARLAARRVTKGTRSDRTEV